MSIQTYKLAVNQARTPMLSSDQSRPVLVASMDTSGRQPRQYQGSNENIDFNIPQIIYGENFIPTAGGVCSVSYRTKINPVPVIPSSLPLDQVFPLRDAAENSVLFSPSQGQNYVYRADLNRWQGTTVFDLLLGAPDNPRELIDGTTPLISKVTRAYVDGKTLVCYSNLKCDLVAGGGDPRDASLYKWDPATSPPGLVWIAGDTAIDPASIIINLPFAPGTVAGIASSNGYLLVWSQLEIAWAPFDQSLQAFNFAVTQDTEITGAGSVIPEDLQGPITAVVPVAGGFIIFTTKNAVAAFYNSNNFAIPFLFKGISNAGGIESYEQAASEGPVQSVYAYTTGGMQKISLNSAESVFPDVTDFLGGHMIELYDTATNEVTKGEVTIEYFTKLTFCGQRYLVISYGTFPGIFSFALVYDTALDRWGKFRVVHKDCFYYSYGSESGDLTYAMLSDVTYEDLGVMSYATAQIPGGPITYPKQSIAFAQANGVVLIAVLDDRAKTDDSESFIVLGKNQLSRSRMSTVHKVEVDGLRPGGSVGVLPSLNGRTFDPYQAGFIYTQMDDYVEANFDLVTAKNFSIVIKGQFKIPSVIIQASNTDAD